MNLYIYVKLEYNRVIMISCLSKRQKDKAFTLIELLVVISIISLLSSVVFASVNNARAKGSIAAGQRFDNHTHSAFFDDLVLEWNFDSSVGTIVDDQSGNGNNLTLSGATLDLDPKLFSAGKVVSLSSSGSKTAVTGTIKKPPTGDFSISFWVYPTNISQIHYFLSNNYAATNGLWRIGTNDSGSVVFNYYSDGTRTALAGPLKLNQWQHITAVCKGTTIGIYLNGKQTGTTGVTSGCAFTNNIINLNGTYQYYLDNVRVYSKSLSLSFIDGQYLSELPRYEILAQNKP